MRSQFIWTTLEQEQQLKARTVELLVFAKALYYRGEAESKINADVNNMLAVLNFHDALEFIVRAIIEEEAIQHSSHDTLLNLVAAVDKHYKNLGSPKKLPLASQINGLNTTRNNAKHHATPPHAIATQNAKVHTLTFLENVSSDYFALSFDSISQVALVEDQKVRSLLERAEQHIVSGEFLEALTNIKEAFLKAQPSEATYINKQTIHPSFAFPLIVTASRFGAMSDPHANDIRSLGGAVGEVQKTIQEIAEHLENIQSAVALLMMGVDVRRLERFTAVTPYFSLNLGSTSEVMWDGSVEPTREMATEALQFVLEMVTKWEQSGVLGSRFNPFERKQSIGQGDWVVIKTIPNNTL